ncbi:MAG: efflux RND transporter permease subunit [Opitutales bacterium]|nr:efflux RND transporter permease subunit [Opitutales bacterium]
MNSFIASCLGRGRTVILTLVFLLIAGTYSYLTLPRESQPEVQIPIVYVRLHHEGISPEDAERLLLRPMEREMRGLDGLREMRSAAYEGGGNLTLEFRAGHDIDKAMIDVRERVDLAKADLPEETDEPTVNEVNLALEPIIVVSLSGDIPERQLQRVARNLRDAIEAVPEVLEVTIGGAREEAVDILVDPGVFSSYALSLEEIGNRARRNNALIAAGTLDSGTGRLAVKVPGLFESAVDILELPLKTRGDVVLRTQDIGDLRPTFKDPTGFARLNGTPALTLSVSKRVGENVVSAVRNVRAVVEEEAGDWPAGLEVAFSQDRSRDIELMLADLQNNVISAVVLVMIVCVAALGFRGGLLVGIAIPGSFLTGMLIINLLGLTINIIVLFSLILAVGMLVDGAIVVTEFADRKMNEGLPRGKAYVLASQRMALPITASTVTTLAAFAPLLFWPGVVGEFMKYMPITLIGTLTASLLMALVFVPAIGGLIGKPGPANPAQMRSLAASEAGDLRELSGITGWYVRRLETALRHPFLVLAGAVVLFFAVHTAYQIKGKGVEFFPDVDPEFASLLVRMRGNLSVHEMDTLVREVEERILPVRGIRSLTARTGVSFSGDGVTEDTHGLVQMEFEDWRDRRPAREILREIEYRVEGLPGVRICRVDDSETGNPVFAVETRFGMSLGRIQRHIQGAVGRMKLARPGLEVRVRDGSKVMYPDGGDFPLAVFAIRGDEVNGRGLRGEVRRVLEGAGIMRAEFGPEEDGPLRVRVYTDGRNRLTADYDRVQAIQRAIRRIDGVRSVEVTTGTHVVPHGTATRLAEIELTRSAGKADDDLQRFENEVADMVRGVPGVIIEQRVLEAGPPTGKDVQVELASNNPALLHPAVQAVREFVDGMEGLRDVDDSRPVPGVEWQVRVDRTAASRFGADVRMLGSYVQFVTNGLLLGTYRPDEADDEVDIRVRFPRSGRDLDGIDNLRVVTEKGVVPARNFIERGPASQVSRINRVDGRRVYTVSANVDRAYGLTDERVREIRAWKDTIELPEGVSVRFRGEDEEQREAMIFLSQAFIVAVFVIGIILVTLFNSFYQAFLILSAVVFSTVGVFLGLLATGQPFGVIMNGVGVIALAGIVVNNNIVLIDTFGHLRRGGLSTAEAALRTGAQRLRPVLLTTVTTAFGLLPMVLRLNVDFLQREVTYNAPSTQWWVQLSTSVVVGLVFATCITLFLTPAMLVLGHRVHVAWKRLLVRVRRRRRAGQGTSAGAVPS